MPQQEATKLGEAPDKSILRGSFPWGRAIAMFSVSVVLLGLSVALWIATGKLITWGSIAPLIIGLIVAIIPFMQWLFPLSPLSPASDARSSPTPERGISSNKEPKKLPLPLDIFHFDETLLPGSDEFYCREYERRTLITRTSKSSSTAIVGDYRIGKSWLLQYLLQIAPTHPQLGQKVRVARVSATHPQCQTTTGLIKRALEVLNVPARKARLNESPLERLSIAVRELRGLNIVPVLCIDEFSGILGKPGFDKDFIMGLRAIMEDDGLVLITASRQSLHKVIENMTGETSPLFNIMQEIALKPFSEGEAHLFINQKGQQAGFTKEERNFVFEHAAVNDLHSQQGWPPLRLQLVGQLLLEDKQQGEAKESAYAIKDPAYQVRFKQRLEEQYNAVVKHL